MNEIGKKLAEILEAASADEVDVPSLMHGVAEVILLERDRCSDIAVEVGIAHQGAGHGEECRLVADAIKTKIDSGEYWADPD